MKTSVGVFGYIFGGVLEGERGGAEVSGGGPNNWTVINGSESL
jgi:hypothetical protein